MKNKTVDTFYCYEGKFTIAQRGEAIAAIAFGDQDFQGKYSSTALTDLAYQQLKEYLEGKRKSFTLPLRPVGTSFQMQVWCLLQAIPYGQTQSYGQIAKALGNRLAARAVGMACNRNPIAIVIPCHRVIGSDGSLTGYAGTLPVKRELLEREQRFSLL